PGATTSTAKSYTVQTKTEAGLSDFIATGVVANSITLEYDAIEAGENSPWRVSADLQANNVVKGTATAGPTIPATLETIEGHLTQIYQGTTATVFASLAELSAHLVQYSLTIEQARPLRPYGSTVDYATNIGLGKRRSTMSAMVRLSATSITDIYDIFDSAGGAVSERRWRIKANGSGTKSLTIDHRVGFMNVTRDPNGRDGEYLLAVEGNATYDSTLATDLTLVIAGVANATLP
nr:hypothetical protein [Gemmatimonadaceae bacterium]